MTIRAKSRDARLVRPAEAQHVTKREKALHHLNKRKICRNIESPDVKTIILQE